MKGSCFIVVLALAGQALGQTTRFAVIGDFGTNTITEADVAARLRTYNPEYVVTVGDNNYVPVGSGVTGMDMAIGQYYRDFIHFQQWPNGNPNQSQYQSQGSPTANFYPAVGNHDWDYGINAHYNYFVLPGNERYYSAQRNNVGLFVVSSDPREPDGTTIGSIQAQWLQGAMLSSPAKWNLVFFHHPAYSSTGSSHGDSPYMRWPYQSWGATAVFQGHNHFYERLRVNNLLYFVDGLGGRDIHTLGAQSPYSELRFNLDYGFMLVEATQSQMVIQFITRAGVVVDGQTIEDVPATSYQMTQGVYVGGGIADLAQSDDSYLLGRSGVLVGPVQYVIQGQVDGAGVQTITLEQEVGGTSGSSAQTEMFNFDTNQWVVVDQHPLGNTDTRSYIPIPEPSEPFISASDEIRARITLTPPPVRMSRSWVGRIDRFGWKASR